MVNADNDTMTACQDENSSTAACCSSDEPGSAAVGEVGRNLSVDPVCGMQVDVNAGKPSSNYAGEVYHFCAERCRERFDDDPWFYLTERHQQLAASQSASLFTCPMDPEIIQEGPGTCSICGMALESMSGVNEGPNEELLDFTRRMKLCLLFSLPLMFFAMAPMLGLVLPAEFNPYLLRWLELLLATAVVVWLGRPIFERGWSSLLTRNLNMWTLIMIGVGTAYVYSLVATVFPMLFPESLVQALTRGGAVADNGQSAAGLLPVFFEAAAVIITLVFVGQVLELRAREKTGDAIRALVDLAPKIARRVLPDGTEYDAPLAHILPDDQVRVRPGESVPVDGEIVEGASSIDESLLTGEPIPVSRANGDAVSAGTINVEGSFIMRAARVGEDTVLGNIVSMVANAQRSRSPMQNLADHVARWFVPTVVLIALFALFVWWVTGPSPALAFGITACVSVLIIACPCALGLATPMSVMTASGRGAQSGILVRDAAALDRLAQVDTVVIDKTGTLTQGRPELVSVEPVGERYRTGDEVLQVAASLERASEHPLARAINLAAGKKTGLETDFVVDQFVAVPGKGVVAACNNEDMLLGNRALMKDHGVTLGASVTNRIGTLEKESGTVVLLASGGELSGLLVVADRIKEDAQESLQALRDEGLHLIMATGDNEHSAAQVAAAVGITDVHAALLPEEKLLLVQSLQAKGKVVAMAGDGINDSPGLAQSDVGIAMGSGADVALESAGITLLHSDLGSLVKARRLATATRKNIKQNLFFAFAYNALGIPLAAGVLYPFFGWLLSPMFAAAAMALSSVSVIGNALRLRRIKL